MRHLFLLLIFVMFLLLSCSGGKQRFQQVKDSDMTIQAMRLEEADANLVGYKVRIVPEKTIMESLNNEQKRRLMYNIDSSFYLSSAKGEQMAVMVQSIANGVSGTYEYLLEFETPGPAEDGLTLVFHDHVINKKTYSIAFK